VTDVLAQLREKFVVRCRGDLDQLRALASAGPLDGQAQRLVHGLAGAGATFGFPEISAAAGRVDDALVEGRAPEAGDVDALIVALEAAVS